jgi:hypothetical protein
MDITVNPNSIRTPEQIKAYKAFSEASKKMEELGKKLQGFDDRVDIDFNQNKGEVAVDSLKLKDSGTTSGYEKFDPATGKMEELDARSNSFSKNFLWSTSDDATYKYKEDEKEKKLEYHSDFTQITSGEKSEDHLLLRKEIRDYDFTVDKGTGDIHCHINEKFDGLDYIK